MKIALVSPWNPNETAIAQNQIDFFNCMCDYVNIDFFSDKEIEVEGISIKELDTNFVKKYDLIHFQWGNNPLHFFEYAFLKKMKSSGIDIPVVSTIHDVDLQYLLRAHEKGRTNRYFSAIKYFRNIYKYIIINRTIPDILTTIEIVNNSDITVVNSHYAKNRLLHESSTFNLKQDKIVTAKLGIDSRRFDINIDVARMRDGMKIPKDKKIFLYVGFLHKIKSVDLVLRAFYYINKFARRNDFFFLIIGEGPDKLRLQSLAKKWIPESSCFMGFVKDVIPYYIIADVIINPRSFSRGETSMAIPEAFSAGKPMIAPNLGCNGEYVTNERGFLTDSNNELDYMDTILYFLENPNEIEKRGLTAKKFTEESLDWRSQAKKFISLYEKAINLHEEGKGSHDRQKR